MIHYGTWAAKNLGRPPQPLPWWFMAWTRHRFGLARRPTTPKNITTAKYGWVIAEWARYARWQLNRSHGVPKPAVGVWPYGKVPKWAWDIAELEAARDPKPKPPSAPPPPPPPASANRALTERAQRVMFTAWAPLAGIKALGRGGKMAVSADLNVSSNAGAHLDAARRAVRQAKDMGTECPVWGNQSQIGIDHIRGFAVDVEASYIIWQAETAGEMVDVGIGEGGNIIQGSPMATDELVLVGNANGWSDAQRTAATRRISEGHLAFIQETYSNCGDPWPENYGTGGVPAASIAPGVGWDRYPHQLPAYKEHTPAAQWPTISPYLVEDFDLTSWAVMPW